MYPCAILADPKGGAWGLAEAVKKRLDEFEKDKFELNEVRYKEFADGELLPQIERNVRRHNCFFIHDSDEDPSRWLVKLCFVNSALRYSDANEVTDILPYFKYARQDRKDKTRVPISAKVVADMIGMYADRALTLDIHNAAIQGFFNIPFDSLHSFPTAAEQVKKYLTKNYPDVFGNLVVMAADVGGGGRADAFAERLGVRDIVIGKKKRNELTGKVDEIKLIGDVVGKNVLVVEDIIGTGGTLIKTADELKKNCAEKLFVYAPHPLFNAGLEEITGRFDVVFAGDTVNRDLRHEKIQRVSFVDLFARAIYKINRGDSLSEMFERVVRNNK